MKNINLLAILCSISGALLLGISTFDNVVSLLSLVALVPMLLVLKRGGFIQTAVLASINSALAVLVMWFLGMEMSWEAALGQFLIFSLPLIFYQHIRLRHNEKLGYLALVSCWVFLEWLAAQYFGKWIGLQLGQSLTSVPILISWYGLLGVSAGTIWILSINIQISRIIAPAEAFTRKNAIINGFIVLAVPILVSILWPVSEKNSKLTAKIKEVDNNILLETENGTTLVAKGQKFDYQFYNGTNDTIVNAKLIDKNGIENAILSKKLRVGNIGGITNQNLMIADLYGIKIGLINIRSALRADLIRLYALEKCSLLLCYDQGSVIAEQILKSRAIENNIDLILMKKGNTKLISKSGKELQLGRDFKIESCKPSFFSHYGDLTGRLSIFVSLWMLFGSFVKPFRKK